MVTSITGAPTQLHALYDVPTYLPRAERPLFEAPTTEIDRSPIPPPSTRIGTRVNKLTRMGDPARVGNNYRPTMSERPCIALVLSGGGARGAYEVGVVRYVRERLGIDTRFDVITGTSVGAINGAYIAATCDRPRAQARALQRVWSQLTIERVYGFGWSQLRSLPRALFGRGLPKTPHGGRAGGLVDATALERIVREQIPWRRLRRTWPGVSSARFR